MNNFVLMAVNSFFLFYRQSIFEKYWENRIHKWTVFFSFSQLLIEKQLIQTIINFQKISEEYLNWLQTKYLLRCISSFRSLKELFYPFYEYNLLFLFVS